MLIKNHYTILSEEAGRYRVRMEEDCPVYEGHFPGEPISPGVCNIQLLRELAEKQLGHAIRLTTIRQCRMTRIVRPGEELDVCIAAADGILTASLGDAMTLKGEFC